MTNRVRDLVVPDDLGMVVILHETGVLDAITPDGFGHGNYEMVADESAYTWTEIVEDYGSCIVVDVILREDVKPLLDG